MANSRGVNTTAKFNECALEMSMQLLEDVGYTYLNGNQIHREMTEVLLVDDLSSSYIAAMLRTVYTE